jgi:hypothetical protein
MHGLLSLNVELRELDVELQKKEAKRLEKMHKKQAI